MNISNNNIGACVLPDGWQSQEHEGTTLYFRTEDVAEDGRVTAQEEHPGKPDGVIALADAIKNNGALTSLDLSSNIIGSEGIKVVAEAIKMIVRMHGCWLFD